MGNGMNLKDTICSLHIITTKYLKRVVKFADEADVHTRPARSDAAEEIPHGPWRCPVRRRCNLKPAAAIATRGAAGGHGGAEIDERKVERCA